MKKFLIVYYSRAGTSKRLLKDSRGFRETIVMADAVRTYLAMELF